MFIRSTKAGAETPATHQCHLSSNRCTRRSTKAGAETPATLGGGAECHPLRIPLNEGRGRDPGDTPIEVASSPSGSLNEGRGRDPGDTIRPCTKYQRPRIPLNEGRGRDPGDTHGAGRVVVAIAQRRPGPRPRRHPPMRLPFAVAVQALNEGRGRDPGDTGWRLLACQRTHTAQRRPGPRPRRHSRCKYPPTAQRRPGPRPRRHPARRNGRRRGDGIAQRRPGPRPRRHLGPVVKPGFTLL